MGWFGGRKGCGWGAVNARRDCGVRDSWWEEWLVVGWRSDWGGRRRYCGVMASLVGGGTVRVAGSWWEEGFWGW